MASINADFALSGILNDGTVSSAPIAIDFNPSYSWADNSYPATNKTIRSYRLSSSNGFDEHY